MSAKHPQPGGTGVQVNGSDATVTGNYIPVTCAPGSNCAGVNTGSQTINGVPTPPQANPEKPQGTGSTTARQDGTGNQQAVQGGTGNQQTTVGGDAKQGGNGDCQQNIIGGSNNTNNCRPVPRSLTPAQTNDLASAIAKIPSGITVKVGSADSGEARDYAEQIRAALGIEREVGVLFGWHQKGIYIGVFSSDWSARLEMCQWRRETLDKESIWDEVRSTSLSRW